MENLPGGLVSTSGKVPAELDDIELVDVADIVQLWKVYSTNPSVHDGDTGYRLQNFFWRIWGSNRLSSSIRGSMLASLFLRISEPGSFTPAPKRKVQIPGTSSSSLKQGKSSAAQLSSGSTGKAPLPPILKKPSTSSSHAESQKTTRLLLTGLGGQSITRKPSNPPTPVPPSRPVMPGDLGGRSGQKTAFVVASKAKSSKRRPVLMRRKSPQQSSVASSAQCSTRAHSPLSDPSPPVEEYPEAPMVQERREITENLTDEPKAYTNEDTDLDPPAELPLTFLSELKDLLNTKAPPPPQRTKIIPPPLGYYSVSAKHRFDVRHLSIENYEQPSPSSLVEKDFRSRFAEQQRLDQLYQTSSSLENPVLSGPGPFGIESATTVGTNDTISPSRFGDSQGDTSTIATSLPASNEAPVPDMFPTSIQANNPSAAGINTLFPPSPFSLPHRPSQLSLMLGHSRGESESTDDMLDQ